MSDYGVTEKGFVIKRMDTIMDEMHADLTQGFGFDTRLKSPSFLNVLVTTTANQQALALTTLYSTEELSVKDPNRRHIHYTVQEPTEPMSERELLWQQIQIRKSGYSQPRSSKSQEKRSTE